MAWYNRRQLNELSTKITDSVLQLQDYLSEVNVINSVYCRWLSDNIRNTNIAEELATLESSMRWKK